MKIYLVSYCVKNETSYYKDSHYGNVTIKCENINELLKKMNEHIMGKYSFNDNWYIIHCSEHQE